MNNKHLIWIMPLCISLGFVLGMGTAVIGEEQLMGEYDLYNCIYNNADGNGFNQHPVMIQKIQDECICFREHNYTDLINADCGGEM